METGKWALVLGTTGGAGAAVARAVAWEPGLNVFGIHRGHHMDEAAKVSKAVEAADRRCHMRISGAGLHEEIVAGADELLKVAGPKSVRLMVHAIANASYGTFTPTDTHWEVLAPRQVQHTFDCMAHSFMWWVQELVKRDLLADGARMIAMTNPMVDSVVAGWGLVAAAKGALRGYVRQLGHELGPKGYVVTLLKFGLVETLAIKRAFPEEEWRYARDYVASITPFRRLSELEEIGRFVGTLAGDTGAWFNGTMIDYTGSQNRGLLDPIFNRRPDVPKRKQ
jgi:3-oxoacyl-[acyl-carrier protein] reductase